MPIFGLESAADECQHWYLQVQRLLNSSVLLIMFNNVILFFHLFLQLRRHCNQWAHGVHLVLFNLQVRYQSLCQKVNNYDWLRIFNSDKSRYIVNFTSSQDIQVKWEEIVTMGRKVINEKYPINDILWYPGTIGRQWHWNNEFSDFTLNLIPT